MAELSKGGFFAFGIFASDVLPENESLPQMTELLFLLSYFSRKPE